MIWYPLQGRRVDLWVRKSGQPHFGAVVGDTLDAETLDVVETLHEMPVGLYDVWVAEPAECLHLRQVALRVGGIRKALHWGMPSRLPE